MMFRQPTHFSRSRTATIGFAATLLLLMSACSLRYDFTECQSTADCARIENRGAGERYQCVANQCVAAPADSTEDVTNPPDTVETPDAPDAPDAPDIIPERDVSDDVEEPQPDTISTACTTTQQCITKFGDSFYCMPAGECVDTAHPQCDPIYYPNDKRNNIVLLGSIIPSRHAAYASLGKTIKNAVRMAILEYSSNALTLQGQQTVAYLHCEGGSKTLAVETAQHLHSIGVPIVVGPLTSDSFIDVMQQVGAANPDPIDGTVENPMGAIAMGATATAIMSLDSLGKYAFQIIANDEMQSWAMADRTQALRYKSCASDDDPECTDTTSCEDKFGAGFSFDAANPSAPCKKNDWKVSVFYKGDQYGDGFRSLLIDRYFGSGIQVKYYEYPDPAELGFDPTRIQLEYTNVVLAALSGEEAQPDADLTVFVGTGEATSLAKLYIGGLSQAQGQLAPFSRRYIFSHGAAADAPGMFSGENALPTQLIPLVEAIAPNIFNEPSYSRWQERYNLVFNEPASTSVGALAYDAAYLALFAMAAIPAGQPIDGSHVTKVISEGRLQDVAGTEVSLQSANASIAARNALRQGNNIDMVGVSGDLNFVFAGDKNLGTVRSNYLGFDVQQISGKSTYEIIPRRIYVLGAGQDRGQWMPIPASP